ncbi:hypothetical protein EW146_g4443 [Bondarzewia mesenterica]|uniref:Protein kinase domain-containing protein n=1 Tax=Bondarzewia mesenterica TaxID=1095465 RepID=A0A4S4LUJ1_9AGAM|nr:hypothetical protein EW146_g4443 [Bondarzewia mesenterica]
MPIPSTFLPDFTANFIDNGKLLLTQRIGGGAYGVVYRAVDTTSPPNNLKEYAVKCMLKADPECPRALAQHREIMMHKRVSCHKNVIALHRVIEDGRYFFFVMDLCLTGDLFEAIMGRKVYENNTNLVKQAFIQIIDAVEACHRKSVFHRDLKPDNILVSSDGSQVWLTDFGLSTTATMSSEFCIGTPNYMSPECVGNEHSRNAYLSRRNDVWSLGVILFIMITRRNPWELARFDNALFRQFLYDDDFFLRGSISMEANKLLRRILAYDPLQRISLAKMRDEIKKIGSFFAGEHPAEADITSITPSSLPSSVASLAPVHRVSSRSDIDVFVIGSMSKASSGSRYSTTPPSSIFCLGDSDSDWESEGPITPETHPAQPAIDVPDLDGKDIGLTSLRDLRESLRELNLVA